MSVPIRNPIQEAREQSGLTRTQFAKRCGILKDTLYNYECGFFVEPSDSLIASCVALGYRNERFRAQYRQFTFLIRKETGRFYNLDEWYMGMLGPPVGNAMRNLRQELNLSRKMFCKKFCVHPARVFEVENDQSKELPIQIRIALCQAGLKPDIVMELSDRIMYCHV